MDLIRKAFSAWLRRRDGATAIEFALVVVPFAITAAFIIELAMVYTAGSLMQGAVQDAVRAVRTGQVQVISDPDEAEGFFREQICEHIPIALVDCNSIQFKVEVLDSFADASTTAEVDEEGNLADDSFETGGSNDIVMVTVLYYHPLLTPIVSAFLSDSPNNTKLMTSVFVFQTEPYDWDDDDEVI
ncbi:MAG: pilus assembly protein [Micavibrio aeruginosavorus]|uniref:Pilus assembly protein n=1 Tax=Micavibrio aeruginosavorus TaxID=349221 RepID=A0A7T5R3P8_9BACT|nr:MAG: pilus assembly protein [Micavibrio aeruginosavorus]